METKKFKLDIHNRYLLQDLTKTPDPDRTEKSKKCFPYLETYYTPKAPDKPFINSSSITPSFIYSDTLNFTKASFSFKKIFRNIELTSNSPSNLSKDFKSLAIHNTLFLNPQKTRNETKSSKLDFRSVIRVKSSQRRKNVNTPKLQPLSRSFNEFQNPDGIKINRLTGVSRVERLRSGKTLKKPLTSPTATEIKDPEDKEAQEYLRVKSELISKYLH